MTSSSFLGEGKKFERLTLLMVLKSIILKEPAVSASQLQGYCVILTPTVKVFFSTRTQEFLPGPREAVKQDVDLM